MKVKAVALIAVNKDSERMTGEEATAGPRRRFVSFNQKIGHAVYFFGAEDSHVVEFLAGLVPELASQQLRLGGMKADEVFFSGLFIFFDYLIYSVIKFILRFLEQ